MSKTDEAVSIGLNAADIAWPIVLVMCVALMILPFVFLVVAWRPEAEEVADGPPD